MKYQIVGSNPAEEEALKSGGAPLPMFDTLLPLIQTRAIVAAVRLGIFEAIGRGTSTAAQLAQTLSADAECLELLLRVLACAEYVTSEGDQYRLTQLAQNTLLPDSRLKLSAMVKWNYFSWQWLEQLEETVKTGEGVDAHGTLGSSENWSLYQKAMLELAQTAAPHVAPLVPIKEGARRMLDIGGGHGLYGAMICRRHPPMRSEVLDLPQAVEHAQKLAREARLDDVVTHRAGNALEDDLGRDYDAVFLGNVVHHFRLTQNRDLFRRVRDVMTPGGTVVIWDYERSDPNTEPDLGGDGMALFFRITSTSQCYTSADYTDWISTAGFVEVTTQTTPLAPSYVLVAGRAQ